MAKPGGIHLLVSRIGPRRTTPRENTDARDRPLNTENPTPLLCGRIGRQFFERNCDLTGPGVLRGVGCNKPLGIPTRVVPAGIIGSPIGVHGKLIVSRVVAIDIDPYRQAVHHGCAGMCRGDSLSRVLCGTRSQNRDTRYRSRPESLSERPFARWCDRQARDAFVQNHASRIRNVPSRLLSDVHLKMVFHLPSSRSRVAFGMFSAFCRPVPPRTVHEHHRRTTRRAKGTL